MRRFRRAWGVVGLCVVWSAFASIAGAYSVRDDIYLRLWCPEDIERFAIELRLSELQRAPEEFRKQWEAHLKAWGWHPDQPLGEAQIMRRVMYGLLQNWPAAEGELTKVWARDRQGAVGYDFMLLVWDVWMRERKALLMEFMGTAPAPDDPRFLAWESRWGPDPVPGSDGFADTRLPEPMDCRWWVTVDTRVPPIFVIAAAEQRRGWRTVFTGPGVYFSATCRAGYTGTVVTDVVSINISDAPLRERAFSHDFPIRWTLWHQGTATFVGHAADPRGEGYFDAAVMVEGVTIEFRIDSVRPENFGVIRDAARMLSVSLFPCDHLMSGGP